MDRHPFRSGPVAALAILCACLLLGACSVAPLPAGHAKRALDPAGFSHAASGPGWVAALVRTEEGPRGVDYSSTTLMPVLLVLRSTGQAQPQVILEDVRGVGAAAEYLAYTPEEAMPLAATRTTGRRVAGAAKGAAVGAGVGGALGAGAGALVSLVAGKPGADLIWVGAASGGAAGALTGAAVGAKGFSSEELEAIRADLHANAWNEDPIAPGSTRSGYLLLPAGQGIASVRLLVRTGEVAQAVTLPIAKGTDSAAHAPASLTAPELATASAAIPPAQEKRPQAAPQPSPARGDLPEEGDEPGNWAEPVDI